MGSFTKKNSLMPEAYPGPIQSSSCLQPFPPKSNLVLSSSPTTCMRATNTTLSGTIHSEVNFYWPVLSGHVKTTFSTNLQAHMGWTFNQSPKLPWNFLITGRLLLPNLCQNSWCLYVVLTYAPITAVVPNSFQVAEHLEK